MTRVATRVALRLAETKRFAIINESTPTPVNSSAIQWYFRNVFTPLMSNTPGSGPYSYQVVGSEIQRPMLKAKFLWALDWGAIFASANINYGSIGLNVLLVAANDATSQGSFTTYPGSGSTGVNNWFYQNDGYKPTLNGNNVKVLAKWSRVVTPPQAGTGTGPIFWGPQVVKGSLRYRWKRRLTFEDVSTVPGTGGPLPAYSLRGWNYYLLVGSRTYANLGTVGTAAFPQFNIDTFLYYKDP